jgi:hypothetical protein
VGPGAGEVTLDWIGEPVFQVFRAADPRDVTEPASKIAETLARIWADTPPGETISFYHVSAREPTIPERITIELTRPNDDPTGRPLPIAGHWNSGRASSSHSGWDPDFVLDHLDAGEYVVPTFNIMMPLQTQEPWSYYESGLNRARAHGIPIAIRFTQWDRLFTDDPKYLNLPAVDNPNVIDAADGTTIVPKSDPDSPVVRWQEVGAEWGSLPVVADMQAAYPDPPLVIWLNNFEQPRLLWGEAETSWRFVQNHGTGLTDDQKREVIGNGWIARDGALWAALHAQLGPSWQATSIPVCYSAFGRRLYGVWSGWDRKSLHIPGRFAPWPLAVSGSPSFYVFADPVVHQATDYELDGPQLAAMNWSFMLDEALRDRPDYFWEVSLYDGGTERHDWYRDVMGQIYDPARYKGYARFALWVAHPRILREFRLARHDRTPYIDYYEVLLEAVKEIHTDADLTRFWRKGQLVRNGAFPHPYQSNLYPGYTDAEVDRNFFLEASVNPPRPWNNNTVLAVFSLAHVLGEAPNREWLLFAYAPLQDYTGVTITIPGHGDVVVDVPRGTGGFWLFSE